jgi:hypothetical protein
MRSGRHGWTRWWRGSVRYLNQFDIQDQVSFGRNRRTVGGGGNLPRTEPQLPGDKDAALPTGLHALRSHIPSEKRTSLSHDRRERLGITQLGLSVVAQHRLAVFVLQRRTGMVVGGVEFAAICR